MTSAIKKNLIYIVILIVGVAGLIFVGVKFFKSSANSQAGQNANQFSQNSQGNNFGGGWSRGSGNRGNFKPLHGTVTSVSSSEIVMKADDGSTKNISVSSTTRIMEMDNGQRTTLAISDIKTGDEINVMASDISQSTISPRMIIVGTFTPPSQGQYQGGGGYYNNGNSSDPNLESNQQS